ncbi:MAG: hypothetical protein IBX64_03760 [Actinobacteria bacterium]|nr:hypothetical protein [Actinomycetota bacterium]
MMYSESYDWWLLAMAFNASKDQQAEIEKYEFTGDEELGTEVHLKGDRVVVAINCRLGYTALDFGQRGGWDFLDEDGDEDEEDGGYEPDDPLLALLTKIRKQFMEGDYRALYVVWETYGAPWIEEEEDEEWAAPPVPVERAGGKVVIDEFRSILAEA